MEVDTSVPPGFPSLLAAVDGEKIHDGADVSNVLGAQVGPRLRGLRPLRRAPTPVVRSQRPTPATPSRPMINSGSRGIRCWFRFPLT